MKITVFAGYYFPRVGGYITNVHELARRLVANGHKVTIITCNTENSLADYELRDGVGIIRLPAWDLVGRTFPLPKPSFALFRLWFRKPEVVFTQTRFFPTSLLGALYAWWWRGTKHIHVERGTCHSVVADKKLSLAVRAYDHTCGALVCRMAEKNVGVSQAACDFTAHLGGKNRRVIPNGVEIE